MMQSDSSYNTERQFLEVLPELQGALADLLSMPTWWESLLGQSAWGLRYQARLESAGYVTAAAQHQVLKEWSRWYEQQYRFIQVLYSLFFPVMERQALLLSTAVCAYTAAKESALVDGAAVEREYIEDLEYAMKKAKRYFQGLKQNRAKRTQQVLQGDLDPTCLHFNSPSLLAPEDESGEAQEFSEVEPQAVPCASSVSPVEEDPAEQDTEVLLGREDSTLVLLPCRGEAEERSASLAERITPLAVTTSPSPAGLDQHIEAMRKITQALGIYLGKLIRDDLPRAEDFPQLLRYFEWALAGALISQVGQTAAIEECLGAWKGALNKMLIQFHSDKNASASYTRHAAALIEARREHQERFKALLQGGSQIWYAGYENFLGSFEYLDACNRVNELIYGHAYESALEETLRLGRELLAVRRYNIGLQRSLIEKLKEYIDFLREDMERTRKLSQEVEELKGKREAQKDDFEAKLAKQAGSFKLRLSAVAARLDRLEGRGPEVSSEASVAPHAVNRSGLYAAPSSASPIAGEAGEKNDLATSLLTT